MPNILLAFVIVNRFLGGGHVKVPHARTKLTIFQAVKFLEIKLLLAMNCRAKKRETTPLQNAVRSRADRNPKIISVCPRIRRALDELLVSLCHYV